jgi:hypothetical protein
MRWRATHPKSGAEEIRPRRSADPQRWWGIDVGLVTTIRPQLQARSPVVAWSSRRRPSAGMASRSVRPSCAAMAALRVARGKRSDLRENRWGGTGLGRRDAKAPLWADSHPRKRSQDVRGRSGAPSLPATSRARRNRRSSIRCASYGGDESDPGVPPARDLDSCSQARGWRVRPTGSGSGGVEARAQSDSGTKVRASAWEADGQGPLVGTVHLPRAARMRSQMGRNWCSEPRCSFIFFYLILFSVFPLFSTILNPNLEFKIKCKFKLILTLQFGHILMWWSYLMRSFCVA